MAGKGAVCLLGRRRILSAVVSADRSWLCYALRILLAFNGLDQAVFLRRRLPLEFDLSFLEGRRFEGELPVQLGVARSGQSAMLAVDSSRLSLTNGLERV